MAEKLGWRCVSTDSLAKHRGVALHLYGNVFVNGLFASIHGLICVWGRCSIHDSAIADVDAEGSLPGARHALAYLYAAGARTQP
jgi:hypothetical protein